MFEIISDFKVNYTLIKVNGLGGDKVLILVLVSPSKHKSSEMVENKAINKQDKKDKIETCVEVIDEENNKEKRVEEELILKKKKKKQQKGHLKCLNDETHI